MEEKLIEQVRLHEVLFNYKLASYRDQHVRQEAWEEIGRELQMPVEKSKDLWDNMRRCFCNAVSRRRDKKSGQATKKMTPWKFEHQISFVLPYLENRKTTSNLNNSIISEEHGINMNIDSNYKTQNINEDNERNVNDETEEILPEEGNVNEKESQDQDKESFENYDVPRTSHIKYPEKARAQLKKNKKFNTNNNPALQMLEIMKENAALIKVKQEEKTIKPKVPTIFDNMDETDIFFLSMSKMTKLLPQVEQDKIKLLLSNTVLQAEIRNMSTHTASQPISSPISSEAATSSSLYSTISSEETQLQHKPTLMLNMSHDIEYL